jgi:hypothetical protein
MEPRETYYLMFNEERERYVLAAEDGTTVDTWPAKRGVRDFTLRDAMRASGRKLDGFARDIGQHSELIHRELDGTLGERRTYPRKSDPKRSRG